MHVLSEHFSQFIDSKAVTFIYQEKKKKKKLYFFVLQEKLYFFRLPNSFEGNSYIFVIFWQSAIYAGQKKHTRKISCNNCRIFYFNILIVFLLPMKEYFEKDSCLRLKVLKWNRVSVSLVNFDDIDKII